jgi:hypothetical protein
MTAQVVDMGDCVRYVTLRDCEDNTLAISSQEPLGNED